MEKYKITLGNPCSFGWENMTATEKGKHCAQCDKIVVDFTIMSDEQILKYLFSHKNACGHFNKSQLGRTMLLHEPKKRKNIQWPAVAAMVIAGFFQVIPSNLSAQIQTTTVNKNPTQENNTNNNTSEAGDYNKKDSLLTLTIKVVDLKTKKAITNAIVTIEGIGKYSTDSKGDFSFLVNWETMPTKIKVTATAILFYNLDLEIDIKTFFKNPFYQLELKKGEDNHLDGGMIYIEKEN